MNYNVFLFKIQALKLHPLVLDAALNGFVAATGPRETLSTPLGVYVFTYCSDRPFSSSVSRFNAILSGSARSARGSPMQRPPSSILITLISTWIEENKQGIINI